MIAISTVWSKKMVNFETLISAYTPSSPKKKVQNNPRISGP
jgi:hypothetical protein